MFTALLHRLRPRNAHSDESISLASRAECCPPPSAHGMAAWRIHVRQWLQLAGPVGAPCGPAAQRDPCTRGATLLQTVQQEFIDALADLQSQQAASLLNRIKVAHSLRELWHLRPEVFERVAIQHSQAEAELRLASLNRHFPTRAPRSGFGALDRTETGR